MIEAIPFAIGFVIYVLFCLITFETYSKTEGLTQAPILFFIYFYYSVLAAYVINLVEVDEKFYIVFVEIMVFLILGSLILWNYYKEKIKPHDQSMYGQNV